jgi:hypothetical protein
MNKQTYYVAQGHEINLGGKSYPAGSRVDLSVSAALYHKSLGRLQDRKPKQPATKAKSE